MKHFYKNVFSYLSVFFLIAAIVLGILSYNTVHSSTYRYYENQYQECYEDYNECYQLSLTVYSFLDPVYETLLDSYNDLMDSWQGYMDKLEAKATMFGILAGFSAVLSAGAFLLCLKTNKKKVQPEPQADQPLYTPDNTEVTEETSVSVETVVTEASTTPEEVDTNTEN